MMVELYLFRLKIETPNFIKSQFSSCHCERSEAISCFQAIMSYFSQEIASAEVHRLATTSNS
jgi:hypothetical protein